MVWDGTRWKQDDTRNAAGLARLLCDEAATECEKASASERVGSAKTVSAVLYLASVDRRLAATVGQWDADPWLLNTPDGTIDLRTGERRAARASDCITQCTTVAPGGECPLWLNFLARVTDGDCALQDYIQRILGYALTGMTIEHALFFLYGTGANGRGKIPMTYLDHGQRGQIRTASMLGHRNGLLNYLKRGD